MLKKGGLRGLAVCGEKESGLTDSVRREVGVIQSAVAGGKSRPVKQLVRVRVEAGRSKRDSISGRCEIQHGTRASHGAPIARAGREIVVGQNVSGVSSTRVGSGAVVAAIAESNIRAWQPAAQNGAQGGESRMPSDPLEFILNRNGERVAQNFDTGIGISNDSCFLAIVGIGLIPINPLAGGVDIDFGGVVIGPVGDAADDRVRLCGTGDGGIASGAGRGNIGAVLKDIEPLDGHRGRVVDGGRVAGSVAGRGFDGETLHALLGGGGRVICGHAIGGIGGGGAGVGILGRPDNRVGKAVGGIGRRSIQIAPKGIVGTGIGGCTGFPICEVGRIGHEVALCGDGDITGRVEAIAPIGIPRCVPCANEPRLRGPGYRTGGVGRTGGGSGFVSSRRLSDRGFHEIHNARSQALGISLVRRRCGFRPFSGDRKKERKHENRNEHDGGQRDDQSGAAPGVLDFEWKAQSFPLRGILCNGILDFSQRLLGTPSARLHPSSLLRYRSGCQPGNRLDFPCQELSAIARVFILLPFFHGL